IPIIGSILVMGYQYEIVEGLHRRSGPYYPDFNIDRFLNYLVRGVWVFLVVLIVSICFVPVQFVLVFLFIALQALASKIGAIAMILAFILFFAVAISAAFMLNLAIVPFELRAGLTQDFGAAMNPSFAWDFVKRMWLECILGFL